MVIHRMKVIHICRFIRDWRKVIYL